MNALLPVAAAEWLKLRSIRSTWWFLGGSLAVMLLVASLEAQDLRAEAAAPASVEEAAAVLPAVVWAHFVLGAFGMLAITGEYATRGIVVTLTCTPSRTRLLLAKTAVVGGVVFAVGVVISVLGMAAGVLVLGDHADVDAARGAGRVFAIGAHLALIAVLALGLGTLIRRSAGTLTVLFVLMMIVPILLQAVAERLGVPSLDTLGNYLPGTAGERFIAGEPAYGLVLAAWAAAAIAAGARALRARDA